MNRWKHFLAASALTVSVYKPPTYVMPSHRGEPLHVGRDDAAPQVRVISSLSALQRVKGWLP